MSPDRPRLTPAPGRLFVYGSLTFPEVLTVLIGRMPSAVAAEAPGWRAAALSERRFPGLVPGPGAARGTVLTGLSPLEWAVLDDFEGPFYDLRPLRLAGDGGTAHAYVCTSDDLVLRSDWNRDEFRAQHLDDYVAMCAGWSQRRG
ncbi:gamma-glutamylcyclotransferase family protein [Actinoplanes sp. NPDC051411]|uniref:gamma-glutamylcyclotransferase family protein n=1 Tax=Actinoplanes sp. NPDC051411 TaxID=3155522 RepID=UPI0034348691